MGAMSVTDRFFGRGFLSRWRGRANIAAPARRPHAATPVAAVHDLEPPATHPVPMVRRLGAWRKGDALPLALDGQVHARIRGRNVVFCVNMAKDPVQDCHRQGRFYEEPELDALLPLLPAGATVLDIGANTGNHALFLALFAKAARVVPVEPNPLALEPLVGNVLSNGLQDVIDLDHLGFGLGGEDSTGWGMKRHERNLGATRMRPGTGEMEVRRGDALFADLMPDLVKIDVEGMEMAVLAGLERTIARGRPLILIEVEAAHRDAFMAWAAARGYDHSSPGLQGPKKANYLLRPRGAAPSRE